ncbi:MAG: acylneuraminate cytidylyltransferase family protein, partial [Muribaculaceae bacterium]|nr:acylneuraminate cytidylyltransferase family protein [Muribaculaceae bacterium]
IKLLGGKPLIHHTIEAALKAGADPRQIIVSTDDDEIALVAAQAGIEVPYRRPRLLGGDTVGSREVILDVMQWADSNGIGYDTIVLLQPTSPLRTPADINDCLDAFILGQTDMAVTVTEAASNPYYNCFETDADGLLHVSKGNGLITRRQDAPPAWEYNGAVYVIDPDAIRRMPMGSFTRRRPSVMPRERSVDLDTPLDWQIAELLLSHSH